jgi:acyl-[acyl-carrier-protein]-phospholipid O-acyltransferase/long-chain-fatty-acid--[acyl-carrier-protein] ligase
MADMSGANLNYGELFEHAAALGRVLARQLGTATHVGLLVPPSVPGAVANIALALRGKVPVNLNYTAGQEHVNSAIRQCGIQEVVVSRRRIERSKIRPAANLIYLEDIPPTVTLWDRLWAAFVARAVPVALLGVVLPGLRDDCLSATAAVLFTSGTTDEPKGVILSHGNILSNIRQVEVQLEPLPGEVVLGVLPFFHAMGHTINLWAVLCLGRKVVFHDNPFDATAIGDLCRQHGVTLIFATPTFMRVYLMRCSREQFATVRRVALGAEKLRPELARDIREKLAVEPLEGYGCTELSPVVSFNVDHAVVAADGRTIAGNRLGTVGRPVPGTMIKTVDPDTRRELPGAAEGVICVKGPQVMVGYLNKPSATAEVLKDGWYITGDIGRLDEDGFLIIGGRLARFSKVAGEMIPHEPIEGELRAAALVEEHDLAVTGLPDSRRGERLVVLYADLGGRSPEEITRILVARGLPGLWIPAAEDYIRVEAIPLLGNGKVDLGQLRRIAQERVGA